MKSKHQIHNAQTPYKQRIQSLTAAAHSKATQVLPKLIIYIAMRYVHTIQSFVIMVQLLGTQKFTDKLTIYLVTQLSAHNT